MIEVTIYKDLASYVSQEFIFNGRFDSDELATKKIESYSASVDPAYTAYVVEYEDAKNNIHYYRYNNVWRNHNAFMKAIMEDNLHD